MSIVKKKINYTVACINEFATRFDITSKEAFDYLYENAGIAFLKENEICEILIDNTVVLLYRCL